MSITALIITIVVIILILGIIRASMRWSDPDSSFLIDLLFLDALGDIISAIFEALGDMDWND